MNKAEQYMYDEFTKKLKGLVEQNKEELHKSFMDEIMVGESIIHSKPDGTIKAIDPMSEEGQEIKDYLENNSGLKEQIDSVNDEEKCTDLNLDMLTKFVEEISKKKE